MFKGRLCSKVTEIMLCFLKGIISEIHRDKSMFNGHLLPKVTNIMLCFLKVRDDLVSLMTTEIMKPFFTDSGP